MDINTFDSSEKYKSLIYINDKFTESPEKFKSLSKLLTKFNKQIKYISTIENIETKKFTLDLLKEFYCNKIATLQNKYDVEILSRITNFIKAKINNNKNGNNN